MRILRNLRFTTPSMVTQVRSCLGAGALLYALLTLAGCQLGLRNAESASGESALPPTLQRLQRFYPDLESGKLICLADFNAPGQEFIARVVSPTGEPGDRAQPVISTQRARNETGPGGLEASLVAAGDRLLIDAVREGSPMFIRDWSAYPLLILSTWAADGGAIVELSIAAGEDLKQRYTRTITLRRGWMLHRIDLAEVAERIDLRDVRAIAIQPTVAQMPLRLAIDDIVLTDNTRPLLPVAEPGKLSARTEGKRTHIASAGRFDLAFADGVITAWTDANDARRNLTVRDGMGPWPVPLSEGWALQKDTPPAYDDPAIYSAWGQSVAAQQQVVELTPFRAVIRGTWRFASPQTVSSPSDLDSAPGHTWTYTIYPSGQVFVHIRSTPGPSGWRTPLVGNAVTISGRVDFTRVNLPDARDGSPVCALWTRRGPGNADLIWAPHSAAAASKRMDLSSAGDARLATVLGDVDALDVVETAHLLRIWPTDLGGVPEALSIAGDYQSPARIETINGSVFKTAPGDLDGDGYNESEGCYELVPAGEILRIRFDPGARLRHGPVFRVRETVGRECWVYSEGKIIRNTGRDAAGNLMFELDRPVESAVRIDVNLKR